MAPAAVFILALVIYTGFAIPTRDMHPWFRWLNWINPVAYAFEALMVNEVGFPHSARSFWLTFVVPRPKDCMLAFNVRTSGPRI